MGSVKSRKVLKGCSMGLLAIGVVMAAAAAFSFYNRYEEIKDEIAMKNTTSEEKPSNAGYGFAIETIYTGDPYLPNALFDYAFKKTDGYINNIDIVNEYGKDTLSPLVDAAKSFTDAMFNVSYKEVPDFTAIEDYVADNIRIIRDEDDENADLIGTKNAQDYVQQVFIDGRLSMEAEYTTDTCMIYYDEYYTTIRGLLTFTVYESSEDLLADMATYYGFDEIELGQPYSVVIDYRMIPGTYYGDYSGYEVAGMDIIHTL